MDSSNKPIPKKKINYLDNAELYNDLVKYRKACNKAKREKRKIPVVPESIGEKLLLLAEHISYRNCYINYQFRDDMVSEGVENSLRYIHNVDLKRPNVFAYFCQIINHAFIRRIQREKGQLYTKYRCIEDTLLNDPRVTQTQYGDEELHQEMLSFMRSYEKNKKSKQKKKREKSSKISKLIKAK